MSGNSAAVEWIEPPDMNLSLWALIKVVILDYYARKHPEITVLGGYVEYADQWSTGELPHGGVAGWWVQVCERIPCDPYPYNNCEYVLMDALGHLHVRDDNE